MKYSNTFYDGFCAGLEFAQKESREKKVIKRARWLPFYIDGASVLCECSYCGYYYADAVQTPTNYKTICPNCGAHMYLLAIDWM